jgi:hypothetical protein
VYRFIGAHQRMYRRRAPEVTELNILEEGHTARPASYFQLSSADLNTNMPGGGAHAGV